MVFTKEAIEKILAVQEEGNEKKIESLLNLYNEDANAMKLNRDDLKNEKKILQEKLAELTEQNAKGAEALATLQKQLEDNSPEAIQKAYEQKKVELENTYKGALAEKDKTLKMLEEQLTTAKESEHSLKCMQEFNREISSYEIETDGLDFVQNLILGTKCVNFFEKDLGNGLQLIDKDGKTIKSSLHAFFETPTGKKFLKNTSSGGGAGTVNQIPQGTVNPWKKETFNLTKQAQMKSENPELAKQMMAAAGF